ncbi:hypothetical protein [Capnocytophaga felis]|uniref:Uncharacterized protein n=1 Tax=Capnocytophaga felis TaxID=2267611 RepID=A0A5M4B6G6_9FLAO|nr:hypothetical protein [Capnocytophaga felis]GET45204.1 hypothetical protein RCZ01_05060 [Capnocytophaga felis]GET47633.1 hypothetical protein RCZ02_04640 [Capnocytophaga felis]
MEIFNKLNTEYILTAYEITKIAKEYTNNYDQEMVIDLIQSLKDEIRIMQEYFIYYFFEELKKCKNQEITMYCNDFAIPIAIEDFDPEKEDFYYGSQTEVKDFYTYIQKAADIENQGIASVVSVVSGDISDKYGERFDLTELECKIRTMSEVKFIGNEIFEINYYNLLEKLISVKTNFEPQPAPVVPEHQLLPNFTEQTNNSELQPDFSEDTEPKEKLILLNELGVIDFLKSKAPFNTSTNAMATALSGILGIKQKTLQSYLNPMFSPNAGQRNNPYENKGLVQKVQQKLISIGYEVKK